ncbi:MAG: hypothetical protein GX444_13560 [Myxococcales bacterium]|nr:hypothetical protein [Myxococcales bacterium]
MKKRLFWLLVIGIVGLTIRFGMASVANECGSEDEDNSYSSCESEQVCPYTFGCWVATGIKATILDCHNKSAQACIDDPYCFYNPVNCNYCTTCVDGNCTGSKDMSIIGEDEESTHTDPL